MGFVVVGFCGGDLSCSVVALWVGAAHWGLFLSNAGVPLPSSGRWGRRDLLWLGFEVGLFGAPLCVPWMVRDASALPSSARAGWQSRVVELV